MFEGLGFFQLVLQEVNQIVRSGPCLGIIFPTGVGIVNGLSDEGYAAVGLHELEIGPGTDGHYLRILFTHVIDIILYRIGVNLCQIEVALVDDFVIGCSIEEAVLAILQFLVIDNISNAVATVGGGSNEVTAEISEQLILLHHVLNVTKNAQVEINGIISTEILTVTIHIGRQHVFAGCSGNTKSQKEDEEA